MCLLLGLRSSTATIHRHRLRWCRNPGRAAARSACLHGMQTWPVPPDPSPRVLSKKRANGLMLPHRSQALAVLPAASSRDAYVRTKRKSLVALNVRLRAQAPIAPLPPFPSRRHHEDKFMWLAQAT
jgi:hypothetical protein